MELIFEQGYDSIKVSHITERANVSRATFYLHYKDKEELLTQSLYEVFDELVEKLGDIQRANLLDYDPKYRKAPFDHAMKYRDLYRVALMTPHGISTISHNAQIYLSQLMEKQLGKMLGNSEKISLPIVANYMAGALLGVISWWLEKDEPDYSSDYMAQTFYWLSNPTLTLLFGMSAPPQQE